MSAYAREDYATAINKLADYINHAQTTRRGAD